MNVVAWMHGYAQTETADEMPCRARPYMNGGGVLPVPPAWRSGEQPGAACKIGAGVWAECWGMRQCCARQQHHFNSLLAWS